MAIGNQEPNHQIQGFMDNCTTYKATSHPYDGILSQSFFSWSGCSLWRHVVLDTLQVKTDKTILFFHDLKLC